MDRKNATPKGRKWNKGNDICKISSTGLPDHLIEDPTRRMRRNM